MSANEHDDDQPDSFEVIEQLRKRTAGMREANEGMAAERDEAIRQSQGYLKHARELIDQNDALHARVAQLAPALIEATAELIYLRQYGKDGAVWWANESKDIWRGKAIAELSMTAPDAPATKRPHPS